MKIVINTCFGGFGLSEKALNKYRIISGNLKLDESNIARDDEHLIEIIEEMGSEANGMYAELAIVEIPNCVLWEIEEYDGKEWISERHRIWS